MTNDPYQIQKASEIILNEFFDLVCVKSNNYNPESKLQSTVFTFDKTEITFAPMESYGTLSFLESTLSYDFLFSFFEKNSSTANNYSILKEAYITYASQEKFHLLFNANFVNRILSESSALFGITSSSLLPAMFFDFSSKDSTKIEKFLNSSIQTSPFQFESQGKKYSLSLRLIKNDFDDWTEPELMDFSFKTPSSIDLFDRMVDTNWKKILINDKSHFLASLNSSFVFNFKQTLFKKFLANSLLEHPVYKMKQLFNS